jgi:hypothetical protein
MPRRGALTIATAALAAASASTPARALDTLETFDLGASDVELYTGYDGFGLSRADGSAYGDMLLGYGITPGFSAAVGATVSADGTFTSGSSAVHLGAFGTPINTHHIDLDLGIDLSEEAGFFAVTPYFEFNLDLHPDLALAGVYLRGELSYFGREQVVGEGEVADGEVAVAATPALGAYLTVAEFHQLLVESDLTWHPRPRDDERRWELGSVALGYNVQILDALELIHEVGADVAQGDESWGYCASLGFLATLP